MLIMTAVKQQNHWAVIKLLLEVEIAGANDRIFLSAFLHDHQK